MESPKPDPSRFAGAGLVRAIEPLKHVRQIRPGDSYTRVAHFGHGEAIISAQRNFDLSIRRSVFHRVIDQDQKQPPERSGVTLNPHRVAGYLVLKSDLFRFGEGAALMAGLAQNFRDVRGREM